MTKGDASPARVYTPLLDKKSRPNLGHVAALNVAAANAASMQAQQRDVTHVDIHRPLPLQHDVAEEGAEFGDDALTVSFSTRMAQVMSPSHGSCGSHLAAGDMCEHCNAPVALRQQLHDALCARDAAHAILARKDAQLAQAGAENARLHEQVTRSSAQVEQLSKRLDSMNEHGKWSNDFPTACRDSPRTLTWHSRSLNPQAVAATHEQRFVAAHAQQQCLQHQLSSLQAEHAQLQHSYEQLLATLATCRHTYTYIHTYIHTDIHTYTYIHTCMHACMHAYMHTCVRARLRTYTYRSGRC